MSTCTDLKWDLGLSIRDVGLIYIKSKNELQIYLPNYLKWAIV